MSTPPGKVDIIMGSQSDWSVMSHAADILKEFAILHRLLVVSAHRTPERLVAYAHQARTDELQVIIAGAGGAAHLPGMVAAMTPVPVLGVPITSTALGGMDSLLSIVQMPGGVPVASFAIGKAGATNAALFAVAMLANRDRDIAAKLDAWRAAQTAAVPFSPKTSNHNEAATTQTHESFQTPPPPYEPSA